MRTGCSLVVGCLLGYSSWLVVWNPLFLDPSDNMFGCFDLAGPFAVAAPQSFVAFFVWQFSNLWNASCCPLQGKSIIIHMLWMFAISERLGPADNKCLLRTYLDLHDRLTEVNHLPGEVCCCRGWGRGLVPPAAPPRPELP